MNELQENLPLYKTFHKLLLARVNGGDIRALPIYNTIGYSVWCYEHVFDLDVVAVISGKNNDIQSLCEPLSCIDDVKELADRCFDGNSLSITYISNPTIPTLLPEELLYDKNGSDNFIKLFPEDIAVMLKTRFGNIKEINYVFYDILLNILDGKHVIHNINDFSYFQTFILRLALTGGINNTLMPYSKARGRNIKSKLPNVRAIIGKSKRHSVTKYISRSSYLSSLRDSCVSTVKPKEKKGDINIEVNKEYRLDRAVRDFYEIQIAPYMNSLKRRN